MANPKQTGTLSHTTNFNDQGNTFENNSVFSSENKASATSFPGAEELTNINWLGSSYSGADIKVVAHLYKPLASSNEEDALDASIAEIQTTSGHLKHFINSFTASAGVVANRDRLDGGVQFILDLARCSSDSSAARILLPRWYSAVKTEAGLRRFKDGITSFAEQYSKTLESLQEKKKNIEEIRNKSTNTVVLGNLQTISIQSYREKEAVRALGTSYVKGYTRGPRTISGSMIFTLFNEHALAKLIRAMSGKGSIYGELDHDLSSYIADQLPPIDLTIVFANEYGSLSQMSIYGVEFVTDGMTMSIEDLLTESVSQFVARDVDVMTSKGNIRLSGQQKGMHFRSDGSPSDPTASDLIFTSKDAYANYLERLGIRRTKVNI